MLSYAIFASAIGLHFFAARSRAASAIFPEYVGGSRVGRAVVAEEITEGVVGRSRGETATDVNGTVPQVSRCIVTVSCYVGLVNGGRSGVGVVLLISLAVGHPVGRAVSQTLRLLTLPIRGGKVPRSFENVEGMGRHYCRTFRILGTLGGGGGVTQAGGGMADNGGQTVAITGGRPSSPWGGVKTLLLKARLFGGGDLS